MINNNKGSFVWSSIEHNTVHSRERYKRRNTVSSCRYPSPTVYHGTPTLTCPIIIKKNNANGIPITLGPMGQNGSVQISSTFLSLYNPDTVNRNLIIKRIKLFDTIRFSTFILLAEKQFRLSFPFSFQQFVLFVCVSWIADVYRWYQLVDWLDFKYDHNNYMDRN